MVKHIMTGGQTGADQGGLFAAQDAGLLTGGWCTKGFRTEKGDERELLQSFGLRETPSRGYAQRTEWNVRDSDGTLILSPNIKSQGTVLTFFQCRDQKKPCFVPKLSTEVSLEVTQAIATWLIHHRITILNVAGNRESKAPGLQELSRNLLYRVFCALRT